MTRLPFLALFVVGCSDSHPPARSDAGASDAGREAGSADAGMDGGASSDDSGAPDSGSPDGGAVMDTGPAELDAGPGRACAHHTDCVLIPRTCCGACSAYTRDDYLAVHRIDENAERRAACQSGMMCPRCFMRPDPALIPVCQNQRCALLDLYPPSMGNVSEYTSCASDMECVLRTNECCECGASVDGLVAIRQDRRADFERIVCAPGSGCPECAPSYEPYFTRCGADAVGQPMRCRVDVVGP